MTYNMKGGPYRLMNEIEMKRGSMKKPRNQQTAGLEIIT
jgi:hypothetical protein